LDTILSQIRPVYCLTAKKVKIIYPEDEGGLFLLGVAALSKLHDAKTQKTVVFMNFV
jgi:hypothetical protein